MLYVIKGFLYNVFKRSSEMGILLNVQLSVFGNDNIETTATNISSLMQKINGLGKFEYLPNIISGQNIDFLAGKVNTVPNLSFITASQLSQIICMDNRMDCVLNFNAEHQDTISNSLQFCKDVLTIMMDDFSILGNRLAININELSNSVLPELLKTKLGQSIASVFDFYKGKTLDEWSTRANNRFPIEISGKSETLNVITELNLVHNSQINEKRILCHLDINTVHENQGFRFSKDDLPSFICEAEKIIGNITNNFEELNSCE